MERTLLAIKREPQISLLRASDLIEFFVVSSVCRDILLCTR